MEIQNKNLTKNLGTRKNGPLVFYSLVHEGSSSERQTCFCVCSGINL